MLQAYWNIGKEIVVEKQRKRKDRADYGDLFNKKPV